MPEAEAVANPRPAAIAIPIASPTLETPRVAHLAALADRPADARIDAKDRQIEPAEAPKTSAKPVAKRAAAKAPRVRKKTLTPKPPSVSSKRPSASKPRTEAQGSSSGGSRRLIPRPLHWCSNPRP